jgi:hypothetical protein
VESYAYKRPPVSVRDKAFSDWSCYYYYSFSSRLWMESLRQPVSQASRPQLTSCSVASSATFEASERRRLGLQSIATVSSSSQARFTDLAYRQAHFRTAVLIAMTSGIFLLHITKGVWRVWRRNWRSTM